MHEMSLAAGVIAIAEKTLRQSRAQRVLAIELEIGELAAVEPAALEFAMDALLPESSAREARVDYHWVPGRARCDDCGAEYALEFIYDPCPHCASFHKDILAGEELLVKSVRLS